MAGDGGCATASVIPRHSRITLEIVGSISWLAGMIATFVGDNGPGAVSLVAGGALAMMLGLIGRWPQRIGVSGNEVTWEAVEATVTSAIAASEGDATEPVTQELRGVLARLEELRLTGTAPAHPAQLYDHAVEAAVRRLLPDAALVPATARSRAVSDFQLQANGRTVALETKWRQDVRRPLEGSTLPRLANSLRPGTILVVVSNALDISPGQEMLDRLMPGHALIVRWRDVRDDSPLAAALVTALERAALVDSRTT